MSYQMRRQMFLTVAATLLALTLTACDRSAQGGPLAWLDRPLDNSTVPLEPLIIQAHASDADGVASIEFLVNQTPLSTVAAGGGRLGEATIEWMPPVPGTYLVRARAVDNNGNYGPDAISFVTVSGESVELPTETPTSTPAAPTAAPTSPTLPPYSGCPEGEAAEVVWPQLDEVQPAQAAPGTEIKVVGSGGYLRCGQGYNESARSFELYFDDQPIGSIACYVNHCEVTLGIPADAASGVHTISVEGGSVINIQVDGQ